MNGFADNFRINLRHLRQVHKLNQSEMAAALCISKGFLARIESGTVQRLELDILQRIWERFGIRPDDILMENWPELLRRKETMI